jgi:hypothetical protein
VLSLQAAIINQLRLNPKRQHTAVDLATALKAPKKTEAIFKICEHLAANGRIRREDGEWWAEALFQG